MEDKHSFELKGVLRRNFTVSVEALEEALAVYDCSFKGTMRVIDTFSIYVNGTVSGDIRDCSLLLQKLMGFQYRFEKLE